MMDMIINFRLFFWLYHIVKSMELKFCRQLFLLGSQNWMLNTKIKNGMLEYKLKSLKIHTKNVRDKMRATTIESYGI